MAERDGVLILATRGGMVAAARKTTAEVEAALLPSPTKKLLKSGHVFIGATQKGQVIRLPPVAGPPSGQDGEVAQSDIVVHFTVLDRKLTSVLNRQIHPVAVGDLAFAPICAAQMQSPPRPLGFE